MTTLRMLDLFSGSGAASRAAAVRGWDVVRIDNGEGTAADIRAELGVWMPAENDWYDLVWASPPCTQLSTAGRARDVAAGLVLVDAALRIIRTLRPRWWVLENVHGATRAIGSRIGPPVACYGSFYLWGVFPPFEALVRREKTKLSGRRRAERRAAIPWAISDGLIRACEDLAKELAPRRLRLGPEVPPSSPRSSSNKAPLEPRSSSTNDDAELAALRSPRPFGELAPVDYRRIAADFTGVRCEGTDIDYPTAWTIARSAPVDEHHPKCSFRVTSGGILCDCHVLYPEQLKAENKHEARKA
jgi:hypothetical protein